MRRLVPALVIVLTGCSSRAPQTWRLTSNLLVPPRVAGPDVVRRTVTIDVARGRGSCANVDIPVERHRNRLRITVSRENLARRPAGWLAAWAADAESRGCIAAGEAVNLANEILNALPLEPRVAFQLLFATNSYLDIGPQNQLQVDSPIFREGSHAKAALQSPGVENDRIEQVGPTQLSVTAKSSPDLIGYETAWYGIRPKPRGAGSVIVSISADRHIAGNVEHRTAPATNYFQFRPDAAFYRLVYRGDQTIIVISAPTRPDLERETRALANDPTACESFAAQSCVLIPHDVGANVDVLVRVNGREIPLRVGSAVMHAIRAAGEAKPENVVARLTVRRLYKGRPVRVEFDPASREILAMTLLGGEEIAWQ